MSALSNCINCATRLTGGEYCPACGQRNRHARLRVREVVADAWQALLDGDLPWWRTLRDLTLRPGQVAADFADGRRIGYVNPVKYCFIIVALATAFDAMVGPSASAPTRNDIPVNLWVLITVPALAGLLRLAFLRHSRSYAETLVYALYLVGHLVLISAITEPLLFGTPDPVPVRFGVYLVLILVWILWAGQRFYAVHAAYNLVAQGVALLVYLVLAMLGYVMLGQLLHGLRA